MRYEAPAVGDRVAALKEARHLNAVPESPERGFPVGFLTGSAGAPHPIVHLSCFANVALCFFPRRRSTMRKIRM